MRHEVSHTHHQIMGMIEVLNDLNYNITYINETFYVTREFHPADNELNVETSLIGKDVTKIIESTPITTGIDLISQRDLTGKITAMKDRRRVFSPNTMYTRYPSQL